MREIEERLRAVSDEGYRELTVKLVPNVPEQHVIGVRMPELKKLAKELSKSPLKDSFLAELPHEYHEENSLHSYLLSLERDFDTAIDLIDRFLPYINNWATCDSLSPVCFKKRPEPLIPHIDRWMGDGHPYAVRFALKCCMSYFLDEKFDESLLEKAASLRSDEYYVNMMTAWYFATALAKQYDSAVKYIEARRLDKWTHNKAIQKAVESFRVTEDHKSYLKTLRIK